MVTEKVTVLNKTGFHIRPAQLFVEKAGQFSSEITVRKDGNNVADGKSILGLMTLGLEEGTAFTITADGQDEHEALDALVALVRDKFGEE